MQVVGRECPVCAQRVLAATEGTWCVACGTVLHAACIARREDVCPTCQRPRAAPERHFVDTRVCTKCLRLHAQPVSACGACGTSMRFDDAQELERRTREILRFARSQLWLGVALLIGGSAGYTVAAMGLVPISGMAGGAFVIMFGASKVWVGRRLRYFG